ncbi:hypothetical protein CEP48_01805 [Mergibacter septicus]|uniref:Uncharacterized protein n=1 Tax=Mergibacter septicus TaxID=221402 RepID=A0A8D4IX24_9PAST|nr:hypothetical protein [Mergibacter septicus]AWX14979.1 hypothetical protein CEP47_01805 [Mergibacter septicus]QDJ14231.1 hypothetical protein CEP48_01805 [Mergibacter septicus]UTU48324.1 hypothetical protein HLL31_05820 [Mergibacter septicus]
MKKTGLALTISIILGLTGCSGGSGGGSSSHANLPKDNTVVINPKPQSNTSTTTSTARLADNAVDTPAESTIDTASNTEKATAEENITHVHLTPDSRSRRIIHGDSKGNEGYGYEDIARQETPVNENSDDAAATVVESTPHSFPDRRPGRIRGKRSVVEPTVETAEAAETEVATEPATVTATATTTTPAPAVTPEKKVEEKRFENGKTADQLPKVPGAKPVSSTTDSYGKTKIVYDNGRVIESYESNDGQEYWRPFPPTNNPAPKQDPKLDGLSFIDKTQAEKLLSDLNKNVEDAKKAASSEGDYVLGYGVDFSKRNYSTTVDKHQVKIKQENGKTTVTVSLDGSIEANDLADNKNMYDFVNANGKNPPKFLVNVGGDSYLGSNGKELLAFGVKSTSMPSSNLDYKGQSIIWTKTTDEQGSYHVGDFTGKYNTSANSFTGTINIGNDNTNHLELTLNASTNGQSSFSGTVTITTAPTSMDSWKSSSLKFDGQLNGAGGKGTSGIIYTDSSSGDAQGKIGGVYAGSASETAK